MGQLIGTRGLPGCGKSTWAHAYARNTGAVVVERDMLRKELFNSWWTGKQEDEARVTKEQHKRVKGLLALGYTVIVSDTNLPDKSIKTWMEIAHHAGAGFAVQDFRDVPLVAVLERNASWERDLHGKVLDQAIILDKHERFIKGRDLSKPVEWSPKPETEIVPYEQPHGGKPVVLVDLDGTLCDHNGRNPYDTSKYREDLPFVNVVNAVNALHKAGFQIDIMTGRWDTFREDCEWWLEKHGIPYTNLTLRHMEGRDDLVKLAMFDKVYRHNPDLSVQFVLDDRNRVVDMYRDVLKIQVFQVAPGDF